MLTCTNIDIPADQTGGLCLTASPPASQRLLPHLLPFCCHEQELQRGDPRSLSMPPEGVAEPHDYEARCGVGCDHSTIRRCRLSQLDRCELSLQ
jgi:hypothetical protein